MRHNYTIKNLEYALNLDEVFEIASISRDACNYYDNGVFILLNYFV